MSKREQKTVKAINETDVGKIYEEHQAELKGFISRRVSFKEDAEDILQNVFYNLSKTDLDENPIEQISSWLYSVARNQIIDRSRKKKEKLILDDKADSDDEFLSDISEILTSTNDTPETVYLQSLVWEELDAALDELPEEQRTVFELTEMQGFSFKEISESTGIPVNTLISRKRYAVLHLRERLKDLYEDIIYS
ncbi:RNA polymerase sigma factor [Paludibacter sp. 221]|uniref:RNA polymerase sigma factor n=1 Tax=Paludibacter sp. 221 TaxID=2302939 RepID=UPI0013D7460F|nr:RNA polymerase sigma factor [Paludibacter sp. 221]NDV47287.1 RNA polymerase sigma factor [Paludibacter sp. 221]